MGRSSARRPIFATAFRRTAESWLQTDSPSDGGGRSSYGRWNSAPLAGSYGRMTDREQMVQHEKRESPLSDREIEEADKRSSTSAKVVHEAIRLEGTEELERPSSSIAWSGLAAGLTMGTSMVGQGLLVAALPDAPWGHLVASLGYTLGFIFVTMARQQLFTETTLTVMLPVLHGTHRFAEVARYWAIV